MKYLLILAFLLVPHLALSKTVTSVAISPQGAAMQSGSTLQFSATCSYDDTSVDNCTAAGGAKWSTSRTTGLTASGSGLVTSTINPAAGQATSGFVIV